MDASLSVFLLLPAFCSSDADFLLFFGALPFSDIERLPETFFRSGRTLTPSDSVREVRRASEEAFFPFSIFCSDVRSAFFVFWLFVCSFCSCGVVPFVLRFSVSDLVTAFFIFLSAGTPDAVCSDLRFSTPAFTFPLCTPSYFVRFSYPDTALFSSPVCTRRLACAECCAERFIIC